MANILSTIDIIGRHALAFFQNECKFVNLGNRSNAPDFLRNVNGYAPGQTIRISRPTNFVVGEGAVSTPQGLQQRTFDLVLEKQFNVDFGFTGVDLTVNITPENIQYFGVKGAAISLANQVDNYIAQKLHSTVYNRFGTVATSLNSPATFNIWKEQLVKRAVVGQYSAVLNPSDQTLLANSMQNFFNTKMNSDTLIKGKVAELVDTDVYMDQNLTTKQVGTFSGTPAINGAGQSGSSLVTNGWGAGSVLQAGDVFYISSGTPVYSVNPVNLQPIGATTNDLQRFIVTATATADGGGNMTIPISPAIQLTGPYQNVTNSPSNGALLTVVGTSAASYRENFMFDEDGIQLAVVPLVAFEKNSGVLQRIVSDQRTGVSMALTVYTDGRTFSQNLRMDVLCGALIDPTRTTSYIAGAAL